MKREMQIAAVASALGVVLYLSILAGHKSPAVENTAQGPSIKQLVALTVQTWGTPALGSCADYLITQPTEADGGPARVAEHYRICNVPADAGQDAGWTVAPAPCEALDSGGQACPDATVLVPLPVEPEPMPAEIVARKCEKAAKEVCAVDAGEDYKERLCRVAEENACNNAAASAVGVRLKGVEYPMALGAKDLDKIPLKQVQGICACAPNGDLYDAGGTRCKEWVATPGLDGGDWRNAPPGRVLTTYKGQQCWPVDCTETEVRSYPGAWVEGTPCAYPNDAGAPGPDAGDSGL